MTFHKTQVRSGVPATRGQSNTVYPFLGGGSPERRILLKRRFQGTHSMPGRLVLPQGRPLGGVLDTVEKG